jgi:hypothetical protein
LLPLRLLSLTYIPLPCELRGWISKRVGLALSSTRRERSQARTHGIGSRTSDETDWLTRSRSPSAGNAWVISVGMPDRAGNDSRTMLPVARVVPLRTVNERLRARYSKTKHRPKPENKAQGNPGNRGKENRGNLSNGSGQSARKNTASEGPGDVRLVRLRLIILRCGEGRRASNSVRKYLLPRLESCPGSCDLQGRAATDRARNRRIAGCSRFRRWSITASRRSRPLPNVFAESGTG